ncbi:MAG: hypothetical protein JJU12_06965 [Chlamydiales bacterium]|nr:hypothetical protein [Chlamydiales bacterium]
MRPTVRKISRFLTFHPDIFVNDPAYQLATLRHAPEMSEIIWEVKQALKKGIAPIKSDHGTSETFILRGIDERPIAVFKLDHYVKEYAAYRVDHKRFANVPPTVVTTLEDPVFGGKATGSCQLFIEGGVPAVEIEKKAFKGFSRSTIRRMAQLDIRLLNEDRHTSNILVLDREEVVPIDHGYILTSELGRVNFVWESWGQSATPFSEEEQAYISYLDPDRDRAILIEELGMQEKVANRHYVSSMLLKLGVIHGFYPNAIGDMLSRTYHRSAPKSKFEILIERLLERNAREWITFTKYVNQEIEGILEEYEVDQHRNFSVIGRVSGRPDYHSQ